MSVTAFTFFISFEPVLIRAPKIAIRDSEGYFTIVDRKKELIKYKGFQGDPSLYSALSVV